MNESNASLETSKQNPQPNSQAANNPAKVDAGNAKPEPKTLADIFGDSSDETNTEMVLEDNEPDDPSKPVDSLDRLIKRHGLTPEQAYAIKIPMKDGAEPLTIGTLKDRVGELQSFELRETEFDERRIRQEGELLRAQQEIRDLLDVLPKEAVKPEVWDKIRNRHAETQRREVQLTMQHIPEWRDNEKRTTEINGMVEMLSDYGFPPSFINSLHDHRIFKFLRDSYVIRTRIKKSLENVRDPAKKGGARPSPKMKAGVKPGATNTKESKFPTQQDKIMRFLNSGNS